MYFMLGRTEAGSLLSVTGKYMRNYKKARLKCWPACKDVLWSHPFLTCGIKLRRNDARGGTWHAVTRERTKDFAVSNFVIFTIFVLLD